jgi:hypothetical protein
MFRLGFAVFAPYRTSSDFTDPDRHIEPTSRQRPRILGDGLRYHDHSVARRS